MWVAGPKKPSLPSSRSNVPAGRSAWAWREVSPSLCGREIQRRLIAAVLLFVRRQYAAGDLALLDRFEERAEIALAEALVALALNDLEEDRSDRGLSKDLQQQPPAGSAVEQDAIGLHAGH